MAVPKRKVSKARRDRRRTAKERVKVNGFVECPKCHEMKLPHRVCRECGHYDGKEVLSV
jgi:large subunit ribosomal protein L32